MTLELLLSCLRSAGIKVQICQQSSRSGRAPFASIEDAQAAVNAWRKDYNTRRPHQSLNMAFPAHRFTDPAADAIALRIPAELTRQPPAVDTCLNATTRRQHRLRRIPAGQAGQRRGAGPDAAAVGQQLWLGPTMTGRTVRIWAGLSQVHVLLGGYRIKTLPSRLDARDLASPPPEHSPPGRRRCRQQPRT